MRASFDRRLRKIEDAIAKHKQLGLIDVFFIPEDCKDVQAFRAQSAATTRKNRVPLFIEFVGPDGGPELGTGPLGSDAEQETHDHS